MPPGRAPSAARTDGRQGRTHGHARRGWGRGEHRARRGPTAAKGGHTGTRAGGGGKCGGPRPATAPKAGAIKGARAHARRPPPSTARGNDREGRREHHATARRPCPSPEHGPGERPRRTAGAPRDGAQTLPLPRARPGGTPAKDGGSTTRRRATPAARPRPACPLPALSLPRLSVKLC